MQWQLAAAGLVERLQVLGEEPALEKLPFVGVLHQSSKLAASVGQHQTPSLRR